MNWLGVPGWLAAALCFAALAAWLVPLGAARRLPGSRGWLLMALRAGWLAAALVLALGLRWPSQHDARPVMVALHAHAGASLPAHWRDAFQWQQVQLAASPPAAESRTDRPPLSGPSDLGAALAEWSGDEHVPDGFVLLGSADPVGVGSPPAPLFVVQERLPDADRQLVFNGLEAPQHTVAGVSFEVSAGFLGGPGCESEDWAVRLLGPEGEEDMRSAVCEPGVFRTVELRSAPTSHGSWDYRLEWRGDGEAAGSIAFTVEVTGEPAAILFLEESPAWEVTFLRRTTKELLGAQPHTLARLSPRHVFRGPDLQVPAQGFGLEKLSPERFRLLVLREPVLIDADVQWIRRFVSHRGGALLVLGSMPDELEFLAPLPVGEAVARGPGVLALTPTGRGHPVLAEAGENLPEMPELELEFSPAARLPRATRVLATAGGHPWMAVRRYGAGRVLQVAGPETYRWKMRGEPPAAIYDALWRGTVAWLVEPAGPRQSIRAAVTAAMQGSRVPVHVDIRDEDFLPGTTPARLQAGSVLMPVAFRPGSYRGWVPMGASGRKTALASGQGAWIAADRRPGHARQALSEVASRSGGRILYPDNPPPRIEGGQGPLSSVEWKRARGSWWLPAVLLALAAAEWGARRRWGCEG